MTAIINTIRKCFQGDSSETSKNKHIIIFVKGNWVDINYVIPTGPQTCDVLFDWYLDTDVYNKMSKREREETIAENIRER